MEVVMRELNSNEIQKVSGGWDNTENPLQISIPSFQGDLPTNNDSIGDGGASLPGDANDVYNEVLVGVYVDQDGDGDMDYHYYEGATIWGDDTDGNGYVDWFEDGWANGQGGTANFNGIQIWLDTIS
jgi:hypothetical protein